VLISAWASQFLSWPTQIAIAGDAVEEIPGLMYYEIEGSINRASVTGTSTRSSITGSSRRHTITGRMTLADIND
jgi:hypothetical protein